MTKLVNVAMTVLNVLMIVVLVLMLSSCSWLKSETKETASNVVDCTTANVKALNRQFGPVVEEVLIQATSDDGKVDWDRVKHASRGFAVSTGLCVLANVVSRALLPIQKALDAPQSSPLELDQGALRTGWDAMAAELYGGRKFKTEAGLL